MKIVIEGRLADHPQIGDDGQVQVFHPEDTLTFESADPDGPETEAHLSSVTVTSCMATVPGFVTV